MADVNINKYRASVVRSGSTPATPGFVVSEGQNPVEPAGSEQNHLPVTINATATGLAITTDQVLSGAGTVGQYIRGDGSLADFPSSTGGGSSVSYYLNGSVSQGTIGGVAYKELSKTPILGSGTNFTINANGYIAQFLTDAGDPNLLEIPGGNWNFETYFSASSGGGSPTFYVELYKYDGSTFTLIASNSGNPELIAFGTNVTSYFSTLAVPTTALTLTDRLAIRYYVTHSGRTITLHTENNHLCQVITTFTTGLTALNGLTAQVQYFAVGTSGTDFNIASATQTHTFNLPTASASNRGALSSADWSTFNAKQNALTLTTSGSSGASTLVGATLNVPTYTLSGLGGVPTSRQLTINGTAFDLSADRSWSVGTVTSVGLSSATSGVTIGNTPVTGSGTITLAIATATSTQQGLLSSTDWSTFNNKQNALTLTTTGTSGAATLVGATLNIPQYQAAGTYVTSVTASSPLASSGGTTPNITIQQASGSQSGFLSSTDWTTFNNKQNALTNPVTGTGTTNYLPKFTGSTTIGNSQLFDNGTNVGIGTASPDRKLGILVSPSATGDDGINITNGLTPFILTRTGASYTYRGVAANAGMIYSSSNIALLADGSNITFHNGNGQVASIQSNGNLLVGTTTDNGQRLQVNGTGGIRVNEDGSGTKVISIRSDFAGVDPAVNVVTNNSLLLMTNNTERMRITSSGNLLVGTTSDNGARLQVSGTATFSSTVTSNGAGFIIQGDQQYRMNGYNSGYSYITTNAGFNSSYNGVGIFSNATNANSLPAWLLDLGGLDGPTRGITDAFVIARKASGGSWNNYLAINASGNVGIGTSSPVYTLDVRGRIYAGTALLIGESGSGYSLIESTGGNGIWLRPNGVSSPSGMFINTSGNVGIGTSSPSGLLHVKSSGAYGSLLVDNTGTTGGGYFASLQNGSTRGIIAVTGAIEGNTTSDFGMFAETGGALRFYVNGSATRVMSLTSSGNLLVGTTTDNGARLQVSGFARFDRGTLQFTLNPSYAGGNVYSQLQSTGALALATGGDNNRLYIDTSGNVGIGTSSPIFGSFSRLTVGNSSSDGGITIQSSSTGISRLFFAKDDTSNVEGLIRYPHSTNQMQFWTAATQQMTITSGGNVLIGTTTDSGDKLRVNGNTFTNTIMTYNPENDNRSGVAWRLGAASIGAVTPNRRLRVNVGGVEYYIGAVEV